MGASGEKGRIGEMGEMGEMGRMTKVYRVTPVTASFCQINLTLHNSVERQSKPSRQNKKLVCKFCD